MFEQAKREQSQRNRMAAVEAELRELAEAGRLYYTPILLEPEPWRTYALACIDGDSIEAGRPIKMMDRALNLPDIRLVVVDPGRVERLGKNGISYEVVENRRIPGTNKTRRTQVPKILGADEILPHRTARGILVRSGYPIIDTRTNGRKQGNVVEVEWLRDEAKLPDCLPELRELLARIEGAPQETPKRNKQRGFDAAGATP